MLKIGYTVALVVMLSTESAIPSTSAQTEAKKLFLLSDDHRKEWCAYASESTWKSQVELSGAGTVATLDFSSGHITLIDVTTEDEAGDWAVFDHYSLTDAGELQQLRRKVNILPGDRSVAETYTITERKARLQNRTTTSLSTGEKLKNAEEWLPEVRVVTRLSDFPFAALTTLKYSDVLSKSKICAPTQGRASVP
jgi:hypothetical protein